jgi:nitric oxide reductase NorD protein
VPEAEDVLIEAAERATHVLRGLWERGARGEAGREERGAERRLARWLTACFGRSWPLVATDAPRAPGWVGRVLRSPAPWQQAPVATASTDGVRILLPRALLAQAGPGGDGGLLAALGLGRRLAMGRLAALPGGPGVARDLAWALEAALAEAHLARELPGLGPAFAAARARALAVRPAPEDLRPAERAVEVRVRALLADPGAALASLPGLAPSDPAPEPIAAAAEAFAAALGPGERARYRGTAPVAHWGVPAALAAASPPASHASAGAPSRLPSRRLPRRLARRPAEAQDERAGPFVLPFGDPHLSVDDPAGLGRPPDAGAEDLDVLAEELARLDELGVVRSETRVAELLEGDDEPRPGSAPAAVDGGGEVVWLYPEWDANAGAYRVPGCRLREVAVPALDGDWAERVLRDQRPLLERLRRQFEALRPRRSRIDRQLDGDALDLASWVDEWAERRAGRTPAGRLYSRERRRRREVAVALLLDASGSTDAWVAGRQRVIDVAREAALCFCETLAVLGDRHAVYAFSGTGAADVRVRVLRRFEERAGAGARARIGGLAPDAFTRLGAPLRHVAARLAREPARVRLLLLLSDGKPDDEDLYEGDYGVEDVRQAVAEARLQGVHVFCVTIDRHGESYLPRMFGPAGYTVLWNVSQLPERLPQIYRRLTAAAAR